MINDDFLARYSLSVDSKHWLDYFRKIKKEMRELLIGIDYSDLLLINKEYVKKGDKLILLEGSEKSKLIESFSDEDLNNYKLIIKII